MEISSNSYSISIGDYSQSVEKSRQQTELSSNKKNQTANSQNHTDNVTLSEKGRNLTRSHSLSKDITQTRIGQKSTESLDSQEIKQLLELKQRDAEVRTHELAHLAAAGRYSRGGASFTYQKGPDGVSYAVGGEVGIDTGKERTPEATITKMQIIKRAALAPASPSAADRSIAAQASVMESQARQEVLLRRQEELLRVDDVENPAIEQAIPAKKKSSENSILSPKYSTLRTMIAAYHRVADY